MEKGKGDKEGTESGKGGSRRDCRSDPYTCIEGPGEKGRVRRESLKVAIDEFNKLELIGVRPRTHAGQEIGLASLSHPLVTALSLQPLVEHAV